MPRLAVVAARERCPRGLSPPLPSSPPPGAFFPRECLGFILETAPPLPDPLNLLPRSPIKPFIWRFRARWITVPRGPNIPAWAWYASRLLFLPERIQVISPPELSPIFVPVHGNSGFSCSILCIKAFSLEGCRPAPQLPRELLFPESRFLILLLIVFLALCIFSPSRLGV